jgi:hypothetical protein
VVSSDLAVLFIDGMPEGVPDTIDARCARLSFSWTSTDPVCCAHGAPIDVRSKIGLQKIASFAWAPDGPILDNDAPSGVIERLADLPNCAALDPNIANGGVRGDGCGVRLASRAQAIREDLYLLPACALFPLDLIGGVIAPSPRIPEHAFVDARDGAASLWDEGRARFAIRYGDGAARLIDEAVRDLRSRRSRGIHLKTIR